MDVNDDGVIAIADAVYGINFLFKLAPPPVEPFPRPGFDPTPTDPYLEGDEAPFYKSGNNEPVEDATAIGESVVCKGTHNRYQHYQIHSHSG